MSNPVWCGGWSAVLATGVLLSACGSDSGQASSGDGRDSGMDASAKQGSARDSVRSASGKTGKDAGGGSGGNGGGGGTAGSGGKKSSAKTSASSAHADDDRDAGADSNKDKEAAKKPEDKQGDQTEARDAAASDAAAAADEPAAHCDADHEPEIPALAVEPVVANSGLYTLAFATQPPGSDDWYLVEQRGRIMIWRDGKLLDQPFLDFQDEISLGAGFDQTTITYDERGLVGLAFAPDYKDSGLFYITITPSTPDAFFMEGQGLQQDHDQVLELKRSDSDADRAEKSVVRSLIDVGSAPQALGNIHNMNTVRFGPDGMLYVGMGDGGGVNCGDAEPNASQDVQKPFGKIMRLDLSRPEPYGAADNPFADVSGGERVLHYGVRNPFRFTFDRKTGDLYFGDVGQSRYEEINFAPASSKGLNFGWATYEAKAMCPGPFRPLRDGSSPTQPIFYADRTGTSRFRDYRAIVGGVVYRGKDLPELDGTYIFGDYYGERLGALKQCGDATSPPNVINKNCDPNFPEPCFQSKGTSTFRQLTAIVEDHAGEIFLIANGDSLFKVVRGN